MDIILKAREETGLPIDIEVMDSDQLKLALEAKVDVLQVGTRNALNYSLLKEIGNLSAGSNAAVLLKRGRHVASPNEFIAAAEYIVAEGNPNVMLCPSRNDTNLKVIETIQTKLYRLFKKQTHGHQW